MKVGHLNAQNINISSRWNVIENLEEITSLILTENFNIFALSETWFNASIPNHLFDIPGFRPLIRLDRSDGRRAGGVALYVSSEFAPRRGLHLETNEFELLWVEEKINSFTLICGVYYRPEYASNETNMQFVENLQSCIDKINQEPDTFLVLLGDFNSHYDSTNPSECSDFGCLLYQWFECNNLYQVITEPTRVTELGAMLLDLIIANYPGFFVCSGTYSPPANRDHSFIFAKFCISFSKRKCYTRQVSDYSSLNEEFLNSCLNGFD